MTKNLLPFCGIELPTTQTNSKSSENISQINIARVLEFKKEKKEVIIRIIYSFVGFVTVNAHLFFYARLILRVMICQLIAGLWEFSFLSF